MTLTTALVLATFTLGQIVIAFAVLNRWMMQQRDSWFKDPVNALFGVLMVPGALAALWLGRSTAAVEGFVTLEPRTAGAWGLLALWVTGLLVAAVLGAQRAWRRDLSQAPVTLTRRTAQSQSVARGGGLPGLRVTTQALEITELDLTLPNLPVGLDGLRLLHLSDFHHEFTPGLTHRAIEAAGELDPDLVAITGDFIVRSTEPLADLCSRLSGLAAPLGVWTIRGNHDIWHGGAAVAETLAHHGLGPLTNRAVDVRTGRGDLRLIGIEHHWEPVADWDALLDANGTSCRIALSHGPDNFPRLARAGVDLVLAGHTHGGQWRLPLVGSLVVPSRHGTRYDCGLFEENGSLMWVTR
jgi:predicted MPP superfamily phosphohydrolase